MPYKFMRSPIGGMNGKVPYTNFLINAFGRSSIVALYANNENTGTTVKDVVNNFNGTTTGVTLANTPAPFGSLGNAAYFDGTTSYIDIYSAGFNTALNKTEGGVIVWSKPFNATTIIDGAIRRMIYLFADSNNRIALGKSSTNNTYSFFQIAGSVNKGNASITNTSLGWTMNTLGWSKSGDAVKTYLNNGQVGSTATGLGTWVGNLSSSTTLIGAATKTPTEVWKGWLSVILILNRPPLLSEISHAYYGR